jgi:hypothetical protein
MRKCCAVWDGSNEDIAILTPAPLSTLKGVRKGVSYFGQTPRGKRWRILKLQNDFSSRLTPRVNHGLRHSDRSPLVGCYLRHSHGRFPGRVRRVIGPVHLSHGFDAALDALRRLPGGPAARKQYRRYDGYPRGTSDHGSSARLGAGCGLVVNFVQIPSANERMLDSIEALAAKLVG